MKLSRILAVLFLLVLACGFAACNPVKSTSLASKAVEEFHAKLDAGEFKAIYDGAHATFKSGSSEAEVVSKLEAVHGKLGKVQSTETMGRSVNPRNFVVNIGFTCQTKFAEGEATEFFDYRIEDDRAYPTNPETDGCRGGLRPPTARRSALPRQRAWNCRTGSKALLSKYDIESPALTAK